MKLLKILAIGLFLFSALSVWATEPLHVMPATPLADTTKPQTDSSALAAKAIEKTSKGDKPPKKKSKTKTDDDKDPLCNLRFGIKAGFNFSSNNGSPNITPPPYLYNPEIGPAAGTTLTLSIGQYIGIRLEVLYSQNAFADQTRVTEYGIQTTYIYYNRLSYIDVPLVFEVWPYRNLGLFAGGDYAFLLNNTYSYVESPVDKTVQLACQNLNGNIHNKIIGFVCGLDYMVYSVDVGARLTFGVPNNNSTWQQNTVITQLTLGYTFKYDRPYR